MSDREPPLEKRDNGQPEPDGGVNLKLIYGLMLLAFLAAMAFAALIVLPFYHRR